MEEQESAVNPAPERAAEPASSSFESREPSAPDAPERAYSEPGGGSEPISPASSSTERGPRESRGYGRGYRGRGGGRGGRRPPPRRRSGGYESDRPASEGAADEYREERADYERSPADEEHEAAAPVEGGEFVEREETSDHDEPRERGTDADYDAAEGEGAYEEPPIRAESGEGYERPAPARPERRERERPPRGGRFDRRDRGRYDRDRDRDRDRGERDRERDRGRDRGRERSIYMELRSQVDRIRHTLETVQRDLERVLQTISQAEHERQLSEQEIESLKQQLSGLHRGGGYARSDRGGGAERERPPERERFNRPEDHD